jgi:hypothetical protein
VPHRKHNTSPFCSQELWSLDHRGGQLGTTITSYYIVACKILGSVIGIATGYVLDDRGVGVPVPVGSRILTWPCAQQCRPRPLPAVCIPGPARTERSHVSVYRYRQWRQYRALSQVIPVSVRTYTAFSINGFSRQVQSVSSWTSLSSGWQYCFLLVRYAKSRKVSGYISDEVIGFFDWPNPSSCTPILWSTQPLREIITRTLPEGKGRPVNKADNFTAICEPIV